MPQNSRKFMKIGISYNAQTYIHFWYCRANSANVMHASKSSQPENSSWYHRTRVSGSLHTQYMCRWAESMWVWHGAHCWKIIQGWQRVDSSIEIEPAELATPSKCITGGQCLSLCVMELTLRKEFMVQ